MSVAQTREYYENVVMTGKGVEKKKKYLVHGGICILFKR